jgi:hypothetical protein
MESEHDEADDPEEWMTVSQPARFARLPKPLQHEGAEVYANGVLLKKRIELALTNRMRLHVAGW